MTVKRGVPSLVVSLLVVMGLMIGAPSANAVSVDKVSGGESALFVPFSDVIAQLNKGIRVSPIRPAYLTFRSLQEGPALRFPVSGGTVESSTMLGTVDHAGGMLIQRFNLTTGAIEASLEVTVPRILNGNMLIGNALGVVPAPTADLVNASHSKNASTGVIHYEADAVVNAVTATVLNTYLSTDYFKGGMKLGRLKSDIQTKKLLL
jgi:hypothetical protein